MHISNGGFTPPFLADKLHVLALDLSGNGDSDWRERYTGELFGKEVMTAESRVDESKPIHRWPQLWRLCFRNLLSLPRENWWTASNGLHYSASEEYVEWGKRVEREE